MSNSRQTSQFNIPCSKFDIQIKVERGSSLKQIGEIPYPTVLRLSQHQLLLPTNISDGKRILH